MGYNSIIREIEEVNIFNCFSPCTFTECYCGTLPNVGEKKPGTGSPDVNCYSDGERVDFVCPPDGTMSGPPYNDCTSGSWGLPFGPTCERQFL